ncbi:hypothetical protein GOV10_05915, partial [Candidatus Woesearchaeota archaeon]|nr:hypothetical protein [Candidatus Woesearchaeota archaeon]
KTSDVNTGPVQTDGYKSVSENVSQVAQVPKIQTPLNQPKWAEDLSSRVVWVAKNNLKTANIRVTPGNLGTIEVRVTMNNEQASISFVSNHAVVRDAIDSASGRLKESFEENGFGDVDVNVSDHSQSEERKQAHDDENVNHNSIALNADSANEEQDSAVSLNHLNIDEGTALGVDTFA